ncbi:MAG: thioredoxin family protein [Anaerolineae bacterium]|jgi:hypothetical protein|nr:MAG: thioredoxin family protein [Anaerolineae bacterium]
MEVELLYFDGCPSWEEALANLNTALALEAIKAQIHLTCVRDNDHAAQVKFLGSPSFRVNGIDLWPEERTRYNLSCRVYATPQGMKGAPSVEMLRQALRDFLKSNQTQFT